MARTGRERHVGEARPLRLVRRVEALGGSVLAAAEDTPYGRIATVADPAGAEFKLRNGPR